MTKEHIRDETAFFITTILCFATVSYMHIIHVSCIHPSISFAAYPLKNHWGGGSQSQFHTQN